MQNQSRCCLLDRLPILEKPGNCCDKINETLNHCLEHTTHEIKWGYDSGEIPPITGMGGWFSR